MLRIIIVFLSLLILFSCDFFDPFYAAMGNPLFVAAGDRLMSSVDGKTWNDSTTIPSYPVNEVVYANGRFVAVDDYGCVLISENGTSWESRTVCTPNNLTSIIYAKKKFVVTGGCEGIWKSDDAVNWETINYNEVSGKWINDIAYGNGRFVCVGWQIAGWSDDGNTFHLSSRPEDFNSVAFGKDLFVAAGFLGIIMMSHDGESWIDIPYNEYIDFMAITYDIGIFIAGGIEISTGKPVLFHSTDGIHWKDVSPYSESGEVITDIQFGNHFFVAVGELETVWRSRDGFLWEEMVRPNFTFNCIGYRP
jgi:hypothetical protein